MCNYDVPRIHIIISLLYTVLQETTNDYGLRMTRVHVQNVASTDIVLNFRLRNRSDITPYIIIKFVDISLTNPGRALTKRWCCYFFFMFIVLPIGVTHPMLIIIILSIVSPYTIKYFIPILYENMQYIIITSTAILHTISPYLSLSHTHTHTQNPFVHFSSRGQFIRAHSFTLDRLV